MSCSRSLSRGAWVLAGAALLASCSGIPLKERDAARRSQFEAHAGKPIPQFTWISHDRGWMPISHYQLVLWSGINQAYLITVSAPCTDLMLARGIGIQPTSNTIYAHFSAITAEGWDCRIEKIQPVDYRRMKQDGR